MKVFVLQLPVWTARKNLEDKCLLHVVVYKLCNADDEAGPNFVDHLGVPAGNVDPHSFWTVGLVLF
jgi:hypothetical protein